MMTSQAQIRVAFWRDHKGRVKRRRRFGATLPQNEQPADTRQAFVDYVDNLQKSGQISENLAQRVTL